MAANKYYECKQVMLFLCNVQDSDDVAAYVTKNIPIIVLFAIVRARFIISCCLPALARRRGLACLYVYVIQAMRFLSIWLLATLRIEAAKHIRTIQHFLLQPSSYILAARSYYNTVNY